MQTIHDFVRKYHVRMTCKAAASNPHMTGHGMSHHRCTLTCGKKRMTITFSQGSGHHGKVPDVESVLSTVALDASGFENNPSIEEFAHEYNFESDDGSSLSARKGRQVYNAVKKQTAALKKLVGDAYEELLYHTESL